MGQSRVLVTTAIYGAICSLTLSAHRQVERGSATATDRPNVKIAETISGDLTMPAALGRILHHTGVSGGIVSVQSDCVSPVKRSWHLQEGTSVVAALDTLAATEKGHKWVFHGGVVSLLPIGPMPALLTVKISAVHISDKGNLTLAVDELFQAKEMKRAVVDLGLDLRLPEAGFAKLNRTQQPSHKAETLDLQGVTVLDALNAIIKGRDGTVWAYRESACGGRISSRLDFSTH